MGVGFLVTFDPKHTRPQIYLAKNNNKEKHPNTPNTPTPTKAKTQKPI